MLQVENLNVYYGAIHALQGISFNVEQGEIVTLIGANGAGKSTTLRTISGLLRSRTGSITLQGPGHLHGGRGKDRPDGHQPRSRGPQDLRSPFRAGKPHDGRLHPQRPGGDPADPGARLQELPPSQGAGHAVRRDALRRRAADAGHGPRAHEPAHPAPPGRALHGLSAPSSWRRSSASSWRSTSRGRASSWWSRTRRWRCPSRSRAYVLETGRIVLSGSAKEIAENPQVKAAYLADLRRGLRRFYFSWCFLRERRTGRNR